MSDQMQVTRMPPLGMITLRGDLGSGAVVAALGALPEALGKAGDALWMSPDELLILCDHAQADAKVAELSAALGGAHALVVNVSDARVMFELRGAALRDTLAKLTPADMAPGAMPVGRVRRTRLAQVAGAIWLEEETTARVICFRSVARYMQDLLENAARPEAAVGFL